MYTCFVVCPFGNETMPGDEPRLYAELLGINENLFGPAEAICKDRGFLVQILDARSIDHGHSDILQSTQACIDAADVVIVVLTANKPNVFLELAWAQGMWKDPILLMRQGYEIPVDINNLIGVPFTAEDAAGHDARRSLSVSKKLADAIIKRLKSPTQQKPFKHWPETTLARGSVHVYNRFSKGIKIDEWSKMLNSAEREITIASTRMSKISKHGFFDAKGKPIGLGGLLLQKALGGTNVTVIMYHEDSLTPGHIKLGGDLDAMKTDVRSSFIAWSTLRRNYENVLRQKRAAGQEIGEGGGFRVVQMKHHTLPFRITLTETRALITFRFYTEVFNSGLCIDARSPEGAIDRDNMPVYSQVKAELEYLIEQNLGFSEQNYQEWERRQAG